MKTRRRVSLATLDPDDPAWKGVELAQRGRMVLDVAAADLEVAEAHFGAFHPTTWHYRQALAEARNAWDHLRALYGTLALKDALEELPLTTLPLETRDARRSIVLVPIRGSTYAAERVEGTELAPRQWRLTKVPPSEDGPYYVCRLKEGATQCDCAEWVYQGEEARRPCKHLAALESLGWI